MINKLASLSIKIKITFTIFFIILFFSIGMIYTAKITLIKNLTSASVNITKDLIKVNETFIVKSLLEDDYWSIYKVLKSLSNLEVIKSIGLINNKNVVIAHTQTDKYSVYQKFDLHDFKGTKIPLLSKNLKLGTFVVTINKNAVNFLFKNINKNLIIAILTLVFISFLIAYFISYRIVKRLDMLSYNAKQIQNGHLDKIIKFIDQLSEFKRVIWLVIAGSLSSLSFAPFYFIATYFICFCILLIITINARSNWTAFLTGYVFGIGHFYAGLYWIGNSFAVEPSVPDWAGYFMVFALSSVLAIYS
ncbi:MAG: hypothetical protein L3J44_04010, partial [Campylobacteraceae bacterium]|nr:hypothetical protein [Campylobacteraceae bacterium]